jgi:hypothetical protein
MRNSRAAARPVTLKSASRNETEGGYFQGSKERTVGAPSSSMTLGELHTFLELGGRAACPPHAGIWSGILGRGCERVKCVPDRLMDDARWIASSWAVPTATACIPCNSDGRVTGDTASRGHGRPKGNATNGVAILGTDATGERAVVTGRSGGTIPSVCRVGPL